MKEKEPAAAQGAAAVVFHAETLRRVRRHARSSMSAEICGVLIGAVRDGGTVVETLIEGEAAEQGGSHVTFTQETWAHIYQVKDTKYPDKRIVGWYHSHPGFGVFLSDHDLFIQRNFFSDPSQVAWVYDPHSDEEGCFAWRGGKVIRLPRIEVRDDAPSDRVGEPERLEPILEPAYTEAPRPGPKQGWSAMKWVTVALTYVLAAMLGFAAAMLLTTRVIFVPVERGPEQSQPARER
jgi:proteasome lid subunit RPN8/RPN11